MTRATRNLLLLLSLGLALRLGAGMLVRHSGFGQLPDSELYLRYAAALDAGKPYNVDGDGARRAPGYPLFLALCRSLLRTDPERAALLAQAALSTATCGLAWQVARMLELAGAPPGTSLITLVLMIFDPYAVVLSALVLSETLFTALLVLCVVLGGRTLSATAPLWALSTGLAAGSAVLVRPSALLLVPLAAGCVAWFGSRPAVPRNLLLAALGFLMVLGPWWLRNALVYRTVVLTTLNVGESLYDGLHPHATGASDMRFLDEARRMDSYRAMGEVERDRYWRRSAIASVSAEPAAAFKLALRKLGRFWSPWPNEARFRQAPIVAATTLGTVPVWLAALFAVWKQRRSAAILVLCLTPVAYFCALHLVFASSVRYRVPVEPFVRILAAAGMAWWWNRRTQG